MRPRYQFPWCIIRHPSPRPQNYKELFNYQHAQLRNVIELILEAQKKQFKVLSVAHEYLLISQAQIVTALAVLHNFISIHDPEDVPDDEDVNPGDADDSLSSGPQRAVTLAGSEQGRLGPAERRDSRTKESYVGRLRGKETP